MASETLGKLIRMFKPENIGESPLAYKRRQWGNLRPDASSILSARKKALFKGFEAFWNEGEEAQRELSYLFQHTGGTMITDDVAEMLSAIQKGVENAHEQARLAWVAMDTALEQARHLARLVVVNEPSQGGTDHA